MYKCDIFVFRLWEKINLSWVSNVFTSLVNYGSFKFSSRIAVTTGVKCRLAPPPCKIAPLPYMGMHPVNFPQFTGFKQ